MTRSSTKLATLLSVGALAVVLAAFTFQGSAPEGDVALAEGSGGESGELSTEVGDSWAAPEWKRPDVPITVALQAGHWKAAEAPDEQEGLRTNGTRGGGKAEWEVNLGIAQETARLLREKGYVVEILPTTIPPGYWADLFVSIHADGSPSSSASGYRAGAPRRDQTGKAEEFVALLDQRYGEATGLPYYGNVTRRMRGYYAFNYRRYDHALHPMTVGAILETGFLTSPRDRRIIVDAQERAARGIFEAITLFLETNSVEPKLADTDPDIET